MKKEELRPIEYHFKTNPKKGYFHKWIVKKDDMGSEFPVGLIENEDGTMIEIAHSSIKFTDS